MAVIHNVTSNTIISGTSNKDSIYNEGSKVTISSEDGNDYIYNYYGGSNTSISGGSGDDSIDNYYSNVTISGGDGNDSIENSSYGSKTSINGDSGDDTIRSYHSNVTIRGGDGNDSIVSGYTNNFISGDTGNDSIILGYQSWFSSIIYKSGDGNDLIEGFNETSTLSIGGGSYSSETVGNDVVITVGDGKISLIGAASLESVNIIGEETPNVNPLNIIGTEGADSIYNSLSGATINALAGNDSITNTGDSVLIDTGNDNDYVYNYGDSGANVTINGGAGKDTLYNWQRGQFVLIDGGEDNDEIYNKYAPNVTITGGTGNDSIENKNGNYAIISGGNGNDSITNSGTKANINLGDDNDYAYNTGASVSIDGGAGKDSIQNFGDGTSIYSGAGDDSIHNGNYATIGVQNAFIDGGAGNDMIVNNGSNMTISGGAGNDYISINYSESLHYGSNILLLYTAGDDTVRGINETDTLRIGDGNATYSKEIVDNDMFLTTGNGVIKLNGAATLDTVNIEGSLVGGGDTTPPDENIINNTVSGASVKGTAYDDTITNSGSNVTINALKGNDCISLGSYSKNNTFVYAQGDGYDTISGFKANDTVSIVGSSNYTKDSIDNNVVISLKGGSIILADVANLTSSVKINGGKEKKIGGVKIENESTEYLLDGTDGRDTLSNSAGGATILGGNGNDSIYNSTKADYVINNSNGYVTIDGGAGNDTIFSYDPNVSISGGANADLISLKSSNFSGITINAGTGNDTIYGNANNYGVLYQYKKGDGDDTIYNFGSNDTLSISGADYTSEVDSIGNVLVSVEGGGLITLIDAADKDIYIYPPSGGKGKFITNSNDNTLLSGSSYADTIKNYGDNVTISAGKGNDTIYNSTGDDTSINAGSGNDSIYGHNNRVTISAGTGKDTITGNHWRSKLSGDGDNDLISITTYWYNTLDGGAGDDTIIAGGSAHSVNGGAGSDLISLSGDALTVAGGADDDTIYGNTATSHLYEYTKGDGNDIIYNYGSNDSITISGSTWTTSTSGKNVIVKVANSGNITLDGAKGKTLNIYPSKVIPTVESGVTAQDVIKKFMGVLDTTSAAGKSALDEAVSIASGGYFANIGAAIEQMTLDCAAAGNATTFLKDYCGIDLNNTDTGAISGYDAGGSATQKGASDIVPETGSLDSFTGNNFTTKGLEVQLSRFDSDVNPYSISYSSLSNDAQKYIWQAFETWWVNGALDLIAESYGDNYGFSDKSSATVKKLYFGFDNEASGTMATTWYWTNRSTGKVSQLAMTVNMYNYNSIDTSNPDGTRSGSGYYLDRVLSHEFTHAVMAANINNFRNLPHFIAEGMAELTHGTDDDRKYEITTLANNSTNLANALNLASSSYYGYAGGYMFLRYLAKQGAEHYPTSSNMGNLSGNGSVSDNDLNPNTVTVKGKLMTLSKDFPNNAIDLRNYSSSVKTVDATALVKGIEITGNTNANSIVAGSGNDTVFANVGNDTLRGGAGDDALCGEAGNDKLYGNDGDDILNGGTGNDTLTGGDGNDIFVHVADNDIITDYTAGKDKIKLVEGNIVGSSVSGSDVILNVGMYGLITVQGGKGKKITIIDGDGNENAIQFITNDNSSKTTLGSSIIMADATARTKAIRLTGNALNNSILGGSGKDSLYGADGNDYLAGGSGNDKLYGQNGDDMLWGGAGNDSLKGGDGADFFIYTAGNDVITDYAVGDKISLGAAISKSSIKGSDATFTIGKNTLTVKNGKGKELVFIDASGTERTIIGGAYLADDSASSKSTLSAWREVGDASERTKAIRLTGNDRNNTILGGSGKDSLYGADGNDYLVGNAGADKIYGQNGNDTLWGGIGNDTLKGGAGADIFIYNSGEGKDVISDFENDDMLQITGTFSASYNKSKKTIAFKVDSTSSAITLKNFTATTFNVNGDTWKISGSKLVKK